MILGSVAEAQTQPAPPRPPKPGRKYTITIDSSPQQAVIYLDDKKYGIVGYTPYTGKLAMGQWTLIVELPGYAPYSQIVNVDRTHKDFMVVLTKQVVPGVIDVQATADQNVNGAQIYIDGVLEGTAPALNNVDKGRHQVEIKKEGFETFSQWVTVSEGQTVTLTPVLKAVVKAVPKGSMLVDADVADAKVFVNGKEQADTTPTLVDNLDEGDYIVVVKKPPATDWKQTVHITGGKREKVYAELKATMGSANKGGNVRVLASIPNADIYLDGTLKGIAPVDLNGIPAGQHIIECKAKGYVDQQKTVTVNEGSADIIKFDMVAVGQAAQPTMGKIKVVSPIPDAKVVIDGATVGTAPVDKDVPAGEHFVIVTQTGYTKFEQKISVEAGQTITVSATLKAVGSVRFLSTPDGADIFLDDVPIGKTPLLKEEIDVGEHIIKLKLDGYVDAPPQNVNVLGGQIAVITATLTKKSDSAEQIAAQKWGLSSFGARTMNQGRFAVALGIGYPYWADAKATVGVRDTAKYGIDVSVGFRSLLTTWEFFGGARYRFLKSDPFALAAFGTIGGGGGFGGRNSFLLQGGALTTITFAPRSNEHAVTITGRAYLDIWSDRLCGLDDMGNNLQSSVPDVCVNTISATDPKVIEAVKLTHHAMTTDAMTAVKDLHERDTYARMMVSFVAEVAINVQMNFYLIFEGAPFQSQRAAHSHIFNGTMVSDTDPIYNGQIGLSIKF